MRRFINLPFLVCFALLSIFSFTTTYGFASEATCGSNRSESKLLGPEPLTQELRTAASVGENIFFKKGSFEEEKFSFLGTVKVGARSWHVVYLTTIWASAGGSCRATPRLLVFGSDKKYLGQYSHFNAIPIRVDKDAIVFDVSDKVSRIKATSVHFTDAGPPTSAYIEGDGPYEFWR
jgi:hypothetical protein